MAAINSIKDTYISNKSTCFECDKQLDINSKVYLFACNHIIHKNCYDLAIQKNDKLHHGSKCLKTRLSTVLGFSVKYPKFFGLKLLFATTYSMIIKVSSGELLLYPFVMGLKCVEAESKKNCYLNAEPTFNYTGIIHELGLSMFNTGLGIYMTDSLIMLGKELAGFVQKIEFKEAEVKNQHEHGVLTNELFIKTIVEHNN